MNSVLGDLMDVCVIAYMDDILIFSKNEAEHEEHLRKAFERFREHQVFVNLEKSSFGKKSVEFLGHIFDETGVSIKEDYKQAIAEWPQLEDKTDVNQFLGLVNYFKNWITDYADICVPLNALRKKDAPWQWTEVHQQAFQKLKDALLKSPVLHYFRPELQTIVHTDSSAFAIGGWIGQINKKGEEHPILYWSRKMQDSETRYSVYEQELLALVEMVRVGRPYIDGRPFIARTDHRALRWLQTQDRLSKRQAGWLERLQELNMTIEYVPGKSNHVADILSRRPDYAPNCPKCRAKLKATSEKVQAVAILELEGLEQHVKLHLEDDDYAQYVREKLRDQPSVRKARSWTSRNDLLYHNERLYIPDCPLRRQLLTAQHDTHHPGVARTTGLLSKKYFWPSLHKDVKAWVKTCDTCQRQKKGDQAQGTLHPLPIPDDRFTDLGMDFFEPPYPMEGFDLLLLVIDRLTKYIRIIPAKKTDDAKTTARRFIESVVKHQGLPDRIVTDRGSVWTSEFWKNLCQELEIEQQLATSRHQQTDGQAERAIGVVKAMMRCYLGSKKANWVQALPILEFAHNATPNTITGESPHKLTFGTDLKGFDLQRKSSQLDDLPGTLTKAKEALGKAQMAQARHYNKKRKELSFEKGDFVLLRREALDSQVQLAASYRAPFIGPYEVLEVDAAKENYRLALPPGMRVHPVFHVSVLRGYQDPGEGRTIHRPGPDDCNEYEVEAVIGQRKRRGQDQYLVKWLGYDASEATWQTAQDLENAPTALAEFLAGGTKGPPGDAHALCVHGPTKTSLARR
jgi:transposase InsO family protein